MRMVWASIVFFVVVWKIVTNWVLGGALGGTTSSLDLALDMTATMLVLIALTLAFSFAAKGEEVAARRRAEVAEWKALGSQPLPEPPAAPSASVTPAAPAESTTCPMCGKYIAWDAQTCRHCGAPLHG